MPSLSELNYFDLGVALIFLFFLIRGLWIGFIRQLAAFFALIGSYIIAGRYASDILPAVEQMIESPKLAFFVSFVLLFLVSALIFTLIGKILQHIMRITLMGWLDRLAGGLLGALKAAILASLVYMFFASTLSATNELLATSHSAPYLQQGSTLLRKVIDDPRLREYFEEKKPAILDDLLPAQEKKKNEEQEGEGSPEENARPEAHMSERQAPGAPLEQAGEENSAAPDQGESRAPLAPHI